MESLVEEAEGVVEVEKASPYLHLPASMGGGKVYKRTIVAELNKVRPCERLSSDRLSKVREAGKVLDRACTRMSTLQPTTDSHTTPPPQTTDAQSRETEDVRDPGEGKVGVGSDFGMAFSEGSGTRKKITCWIGKVELMFRKAGRRSRQKVHHSVDIDDLFDGSYSVVAAWYAPTRRRGVYNFNTVSDPTAYNLAHFVGLVRIDWVPGTTEYELVDTEEQLEALSAAVRRTRTLRPGGKRTIGEEEEALARRVAQQTAPHLQPDTGEVDARLEARKRRAEARASSSVQHPEVDAFLASVAFDPTATAPPPQAPPTQAQAPPPQAPPTQAPRPQAPPTQAPPTQEHEQDGIATEIIDLSTRPPPPTLSPTLASDPLRDMAGDALTERTKPSGGKAECSLATTRNLFRDEAISREWLALRQVGSIGVVEHGVPGRPEGEIGFPDWEHIMQGLVGEGEVVVVFNPQVVGSSELMLDTRVGALFTISPPHVIAIFSDKTSLRPHMRVYDNESSSRIQGQPTGRSPRCLWRNCFVVGITMCGSALHTAVVQQPAVKLPGGRKRKKP